MSCRTGPLIQPMKYLAFLGAEQRETSFQYKKAGIDQVIRLLPKMIVISLCNRAWLFLIARRFRW